MNNEEKMRAIHKSIENGNYELWYEDEKLKELDWKKYFLRYLLNISYGALKQIKPNEGLLNDIQKEYREVKQQLKNYKAD